MMALDGSYDGIGWKVMMAISPVCHSKAQTSTSWRITKVKLLLRFLVWTKVVAHPPRYQHCHSWSHAASMDKNNTNQTKGAEINYFTFYVLH